MRRDTARSFQTHCFSCIYNTNTHFLLLLLLLLSDFLVWILVRKAQMFPSTRWILWESSGVGNLTQPLITHVLLLLSKTHCFHLIRSFSYIYMLDCSRQLTLTGSSLYCHYERQVVQFFYYWALQYDPRAAGQLNHLTGYIRDIIREEPKF